MPDCPCRPTAHLPAGRGSGAGGGACRRGVSPRLAAIARTGAQSRHELLGDLARYELLADLDLAVWAPLVDQPIGERPHELLVLLQAIWSQELPNECSVACVFRWVEGEELS